MLQKILNFPSQVAETFELSKDLVLPSGYDNISSILVVGMGGSGIVGDFLRILLRNSRVPVYVSKHLVPPACVNEKTLVFAVTYSGKTSETLTALDSCIKKGAKIIGITGSRRLKYIFQAIDIPHAHFIEVPYNTQTRTSLGYLLIPILSLLQKGGILRVYDDIVETIESLKSVKQECAPEVPLKMNPARSLAFELLHRFPVIYGVYNFTDAVATRWKQLLNENSKVHCYYDALPELLHNEVEAWNGASSIQENYHAIFLRDSIYEDEIGIKSKVHATEYLLQQAGVKLSELWSKGRSELSRLLSLSYVGDFVSVYLAMARSVDDSSVPNIEFMKKFEYLKR